MKAMNNYAECFPNYEKTPKAVIAAIAFSLAIRMESQDHFLAEDLLKEEWRILHQNGIVPQKPRIVPPKDFDLYPDDFGREGQLDAWADSRESSNPFE